MPGEGFCLLEIGEFGPHSDRMETTLQREVASNGSGERCVRENLNETGRQICSRQFTPQYLRLFTGAFGIGVISLCGNIVRGLGNGREY